MISFLSFGNHTLEESTDSLAKFMPDGLLFRSKNINNTNYQRLLKGFAGEIFNAEGIIRTVIKEYDIRVTTAFLTNWEGALGIPDLCFDNRTSIEQRRLQCLVKLTALGVQTRPDFIRLAELFGIVGITITQDGPFKIIIAWPSSTGGTVFDMVFNFKFLATGRQLLECLFESLVPINVEIENVDI